MKRFWQITIEVGFILFLFYANLLMGEYERSGAGRKNGLVWALRDMATIDNLVIGIIAAILGHVFFEFIRKSLDQADANRSG